MIDDDTSYHADDSEQDVSAFRRALMESGVQRLKPSQRNHADTGQIKPPHNKESLTARRRAAEVNQQQIHTRSRTSDGRVEPVSPSQHLLFSLQDIDQRVIGKLKRGEIPWQEGLDLHGYNVEEAREQVESFLYDAVGNHLRCVLIVHGKAWSTTLGYPVIKSHVNAWLREWPQVLAFSSATPVDGGTGAVYVLLKRPRHED